MQKIGWYVKSSLDGRRKACGPFATAKDAKFHGLAHYDGNECRIWYGTAWEVDGSKEVYSRKAGGFYFRRVVPIIA